MLVFNNSKNPDDNKLHDGSRTIMIYLEGSNLESDYGIASADLAALDSDKLDLEKTTILVYTGGTEKWHNDFVKNDENAIFKFTENGYEKLQRYGKLNMGEANTLANFLTYGFENYPAEHYNLILDDHGGAIDGAIYDDFTDDNLSLEDFAKAMSKSPFDENNKLDSVLFRTCLNGTIEVANIFAPYANYAVFSEEISVGGSSSNVLSFLHSVKSTDNGYEFGKKFIERYQVQVDDLDIFGTTPVTYSIVDLSKIANVNEEMDKFFGGVDIKKYYNQISRVRSNQYQYGMEISAYDMVDLVDLVTKLEDYSSEDADDLLDALDEAIVYNHTNLKTSNGLSIYFPYNGGKYIPKFLGVYNGLDYSESYSKFIKQFNGAKDGAPKFSYDLSKNEAKMDTDKNEVSLKLTDEEIESFSSATYYVFKKDEEHEGYYWLMYVDYGVQLSDDGTVKTNFSKNLFTTVDETDGKSYYLPVMHEKNDKDELFVSRAMMFSNKKSFTDEGYFYVAYVYYAWNDDGDLVVSSAKILEDDDERLQGTLLDFNEYDTMQIRRTNYRLMDNGKYTEDWEVSPVVNLFEADVKDFSLQKAKMDDGEYYVVFYIFDVNNDSHGTGLIKVGE